METLTESTSRLEETNFEWAGLQKATQLSDQDKDIIGRILADLETVDYPTRETRAGIKADYKINITPNSGYFKFSSPGKEFNMPFAYHGYVNNVKIGGKGVFWIITNNKVYWMAYIHPGNWDDVFREMDNNI